MSHTKNSGAIGTLSLVSVFRRTLYSLCSALKIVNLAGRRTVVLAIALKTRDSGQKREQPQMKNKKDRVLFAKILPTAYRIKDMRLLSQ